MDSFEKKYGKGKRPYLIMSDFHRSFSELKLPRTYAQGEDPCKNKVYDFFHNSVKHAAEEIHAVFGKGIGMDIHAMGYTQKAEKGNIQLGFGVGNPGLPFLSQYPKAGKMKGHVYKFLGPLVAEIKKIDAGPQPGHDDTRRVGLGHLSDQRV
jgi:hypothetical protein